MDYNTKRNKINLREYGRNIYKMVELVRLLPNKEERNKQIRAVISVMGNLNPHLRDVRDFRHKLWDHIQIISNFKIDIDSPYPALNKINLHDKPRKVPYPNNPIKIRHYGRCIQDMVDTAAKIENEENKTKLALLIANQMKKMYITWNKDSVSDEQIINDLSELSGGKIKLEKDTKLCNAKTQTPAFAKAQTNQQKKNNKQQRKNKQKKNFMKKF